MTIQEYVERGREAVEAIKDYDQAQKILAAKGLHALENETIYRRFRTEGRAHGTKERGGV